MKLDTKKLFFPMVLVLLVIVVSELTLYLFTFVSPRIDWLLSSPWTSRDYPPTVPDERLIFRPNPAIPGHDRKGFRNPKVPTRAQIVALGDSQTYGTGVAARDAWPRQLESMTGKTVYSMAYGTYGPTHSLILWDEAVSLQPNVVIEAFYAGNDLFDSFQHVYNWNQLPDLKSSEPQLQASIRELERYEPIAKQVKNMFKMGIGTPSVAIDDESTVVTRDGISPWRFLSQHSKIYGLLRRAKYESFRLLRKLNSSTKKTWNREKSFAEAHPAFCQIFDNGQFRTIFTSEYRFSALNLGDHRITEGLNISLRAIKRMHQLAAARNIRFLVVLVPTKETVFRELWTHPSMSYRNLTENEERFRTITKDYFAHNGIEYLDALPVLQKQLALGNQPYPESPDGHPNEHGHMAIAKLIASHLKSP